MDSFTKGKQPIPDEWASAFEETESLKQALRSLRIQAAEVARCVRSIAGAVESPEERREVDVTDIYAAREMLDSLIEVVLAPAADGLNDILHTVCPQEDAATALPAEADGEPPTTH